VLLTPLSQPGQGKMLDEKNQSSKSCKTIPFIKAHPLPLENLTALNRLNPVELEATRETDQR
jgi:hypothetical protein